MYGPFKCQVSAASKALFNLNANFGTLFSHLDEGGVHLSNLPIKELPWCQESHPKNCNLRLNSQNFNFNIQFDLERLKFWIFENIIPITACCMFHTFLTYEVIFTNTVPVYNESHLYFKLYSEKKKSFVVLACPQSTVGMSGNQAYFGFLLVHNISIFQMLIIIIPI